MQAAGKKTCTKKPGPEELFHTSIRFIHGALITRSLTITFFIIHANCWFTMMMTDRTGSDREIPAVNIPMTSNSGAPA